MTPFDLRPPTAEFDVMGGQVTVVDAAGILHRADDGPVQIVQRADLPPGFTAFTITVSRRDYPQGPAYHFLARLTAADLPRQRVPGAGMAAAAGGAWAAAGIAAFNGARFGALVGPAGIVMGGLVGAAAGAAAHRLMHPDTPAAEAPTSPVTSLFTIPYGNMEVLLEAAGSTPGCTLEAAALLSNGPATPQYLLAFAVFAVGVLADRSTVDDLTGKAFLLSHHPGGLRTTDDGKVRLDDIGGLDDVVRQLRTVARSFRHPEALAQWGTRRPQGILLHGPPGTGKTMLVQALATEIGAEVQAVDSADLLGSHVGESEEKVKRVFADARARTTPTILFFDEFDSVIALTDGRDGGSQVLNSIAGIFRVQLNTLSRDNPNILVAAATNFLDERVDATLVRNGRFDYKIEVGPPDQPGRRQILRNLMAGLVMRHETGGFRIFADDVDLDALAVASAGLVGADLAELVRRATFAKAAEAADRRDRGEPGDPPPITQADLLRHLRDVAAEAR